MDKKRRIAKNRQAFLVMWDQYGLEAIFDLNDWQARTDAWEKETIFSVLKEEPHSPAPKIPLRHIILRAQVNSERHYEIYTFIADKGITEKDIRGLFDENPQYIVDFIRKNGFKIYSNRMMADVRIR